MSQYTYCIELHGDDIWWERLKEKKCEKLRFILTNVSLDSQLFRWYDCPGQLLECWVKFHMLKFEESSEELRLTGRHFICSLRSSAYQLSPDTHHCTTKNSSCRKSSRENSEKRNHGWWEDLYNAEAWCCPPRAHCRHHQTVWAERVQTGSNEIHDCMQISLLCILHHNYTF